MSQKGFKPAKEHKQRKFEHLWSNAIALHQTHQYKQAIALYQQLLSRFPEAAYEISMNLGAAYKACGMYPESLRCYRSCLRIKTTDAEIYFNIGNLLSAANHCTWAWHYLNKCKEIQPSHVRCLLSMSNCSLKLNKLNDARDICQQILKLDSKCAQAHENFAAADQKQDTKSAINHLKKAIAFEFTPKRALSLHRLLCKDGRYRESYELTKYIENYSESSTEHVVPRAQSLVYLGKIDQAKDLLGESNIKESSEWMLLNAQIMQIEGNISGSQAIYEKVLADNSNCLEAMVGLLSSIKVKPDNSVFNNLENLYECQAELASDWKANFLLAKCYEDIGDYEKASRYLEVANNLKLNHFKSCSSLQIQRDQASKNLIFAGHQRLVNEPRYSAFIFIVGMPRCGSTLLETMLSSTPGCKDLGETSAFLRAIKTCAHSIKNSIIVDCKTQELCRDTYLSQVRTDTATIYTDKMLYNYRNVNFIHHCLPGAKVIHVHRNPLDNILSIYKADFAKGNRYSSSLKDCATVYHSHQVLMDHWKTLYPHTVYDINYDKMVTDPQAEIRKLVDWLGIAWNEDILSPEKSQRRIQTASIIQARKPINNKSVGRWKKFANMLQPAKEQLLQLDAQRYKSACD